MEAVVLLSGGLDSCVTAAIARTEVAAVGALHVSYGQRTLLRERQAFEAVCEALAMQERLVATIEHLGTIGGSSLTDPALPVSPADLDATQPPSSYVPFRNAHLLCIAVSWAEVRGARVVYIGAVEEDASGYPDCRRAFFDSFEQVVREGTRMESFEIRTPLIGMSKRDIVLVGMRLGAPLHLTWSCYSEADRACGVCDSCALRLRGFQEAGFEDPIPYVQRPFYGRRS